MSEKSQDESAPEETVRVYNRSNTRVFIHGPHRAEKSAFVTVPKSVADRWMRLFSEDIVDAGVATREIGGANAELAEAKAKLAAQEKELEALKAARLPTNVKELQKALKDLKDDHAELQEKHSALEEKLTNPAAGADSGI